MIQSNGLIKGTLFLTPWPFAHSSRYGKRWICLPAAFWTAFVKAIDPASQGEPAPRNGGADRMLQGPQKSNVAEAK
jgi:hypothetical protein